MILLDIGSSEGEKTNPCILVQIIAIEIEFKGLKVYIFYNFWVNP